MKKGFSLIELMIAIVVIFIGFAAVVSMSLSAISSSSSSKAKLKATSFAQGILEKYRAERDANGIAGLINYAKPGAQTIDGVRYMPTVTLYNLNKDSVLVEVKVDWTYKTAESIKSYALLTNYGNGATVPPPYAYPTWYVTPTPLPPTATPTKKTGKATSTPTNTPTPTSSARATNTPTKTPTPTPTIPARATNTPTPTTAPSYFVVDNSASNLSCDDMCLKYNEKSYCAGVGTDSNASNSWMAIFSAKGVCDVSNANCSNVMSVDKSIMCPGSTDGSVKDQMLVIWTRCLCRL